MYVLGGLNMKKSDFPVVNNNRVIGYIMEYSHENDRDEIITRFFGPNEFSLCMRTACYLEAYSDLSGETDFIIYEVTTKGVATITYAGWNPGMRMIWEYANGHIVWNECYPKWGHQK